MTYIEGLLSKYDLEDHYEWAKTVTRYYIPFEKRTYAFDVRTAENFAGGAVRVGEVKLSCNIDWEPTFYKMGWGVYEGPERLKDIFSRHLKGEKLHEASEDENFWEV